MIKVKVPKKTLEIISDIKNHEKYVQKGIKDGFYFLGKELKQDAQKYIQDPPKTGNQYTTSNNPSEWYYRHGEAQGKMTHQASQKGESPANFSGDLKKSIEYFVVDWRRMFFGAGRKSPSGFDMEYAAKLEEAMNRPYLKKSVRNNIRNAKNIFCHQIKKNLKVK